MSLQYSVSLRNARLDVVESHVGAAAIMEMRAGAPPADCATAASGALLAQASLPSDWMAAAAAGAKAKAGTWSLTGLAAGSLGYFRIYEPGSPSVCHIQGTITATGGGGDMTVDNVSVAAAQAISVTGFTLTAGNA